MEHFFHEFIDVPSIELPQYINSLRGFTDLENGIAITENLVKHTTRMVISTFAWIDDTFTQSWFTYTFYDKNDQVLLRINSVDFT